MPAYTAPEILLFIAAISALIVQTIGAWRNGTRSIDTNQKVGETLIKAAVIEGHVNSKETKLTEQLVAYQRENDLLKLMMADKDRTAALLAQAVTSRQQQFRSTDGINGSAIPLEIKGPTEVKIVNDSSERVPVENK